MTHVEERYINGRWVAIRGPLGSRMGRVFLARAAVVRREWASYDPRVLPRKEVKR